MRLHLFSLVFFFISFGIVESYAQGGRVEGHIYSLDSLPLTSIPVKLPKAGLSTQTDAKGFFRIDNVPAGSYQIIFEFSDDEDETRKVQIIPDFTTTLKLYLPYTRYTVKAVEIYPVPAISEVARMPELRNGVIYAGKKNEVINLREINANTPVNNTRQVFAKVPGTNIWENDGNGIQVGIANRGLSPNRSWEYNTRQNGYDISSDIFGYPEAYYTPPMEGVERIEIVRGAASLQFGPQLGGLLNFVTKKGNPNRKFSVESKQTLGSYGLFNSFNAIGGQVGKLNYYTYVNYRRANGWRDNSNFYAVWGYAGLEYKHRRLTVGLQVSGQSFKNQQAGGLSEVMYKNNHRGSSRTRNWFSAPWLIPALNIDYAFTQNTQLSVKAFGLLGERNSVGYVRASNVPDTLTFNRQVDRDFYANIGAEARLSTKYGAKKHVLAFGGRFFSGNTQRQQLGIGNNKLEYDLTLTNPLYGRDLDFNTTNFALFAENVFQLAKGLKVVPGIRYENIANSAEGRFGLNRTTGTETILNPNTRTRSIILLGIGAEWQALKSLQFYGNFAQGYRPVLYSELTPSATTDVIDPNLKDASGFNADLGIRGTFRKFLTYDISVFRLDYDNRIANQGRTEGTNSFIFRTNSPGSRTTGLEAYVELDLLGLVKNSKGFGLNVFVSSAVMEAEYRAGTIRSGTQNIDVSGKKVEYAPEQIHRIGVTGKYKRFSFTYQFGRVGSVFTDILNTEAPNAAGTVGKIPAYELHDLSMTYQFLTYFSARAGINNLTDRKYFTRRAGGYPGPGIIPGDGRVVYVSLGIEF